MCRVCCAMILLDHVHDAMMGFRSRKYSSVAFTHSTTQRCCLDCFSPGTTVVSPRQCRPCDPELTCDALCKPACRDTGSSALGPWLANVLGGWLVSMHRFRVGERLATS